MSGWNVGTKPKKPGRYIVTEKTSFGPIVRQADLIAQHGGGFFWWVLPSGGGDVIAWKKQPEPYSEVKP